MTLFDLGPEPRRDVSFKRWCAHVSMQAVVGEDGHLVALFCPTCRGRFEVKACKVCTLGIRRSLDGANPIGRPRELCTPRCRRERKRLLAIARRAKKRVEKDTARSSKRTEAASTIPLDLFAKVADNDR